MKNEISNGNNQFPVVTAGVVGEEPIQTVNARDLHKFLESKQQFADWIQNRIKQYDFVENQDFITASENYEAKNGGQSSFMTIKPKTQVNAKPMGALILAHLLSGKTITNVEAQALWRCRALPKRISELRTRGYDILAERRKDSTGQFYVRYRLINHDSAI